MFIPVCNFEACETCDIPLEAELFCLEMIRVSMSGMDMGGQRLITTVRPAPNSETADLHAFDVERLLADCIGVLQRRQRLRRLGALHCDGATARYGNRSVPRHSFCSAFPGSNGMGIGTWMCGLCHGEHGRFEDAHGCT
eukprot:g5203.t1